MLNQLLKIGCLFCLGIVLMTCEDATIDYTSDIAGEYIVGTAFIDGITTDYSSLPLEDAWIIDINDESFISYENDINQCDSTYTEELRVIASVTDTSIVFEDDSHFFYSMGTGSLTLYNGEDVITLIAYGSDIPPSSWTDPSQLTNDTYEPDGELSQATSISAAGTIQSHYSAVCDDEDYFSFDALGGTSYIIEAEAGAGSDIDLTLSLYSADGDSVGYNDDQTATNVDPKLEWTCPASGNYYFIVKKYWDYLDPGNSSDDVRGDYTISVDVTKALLKTHPTEIFKRYRPAQSNHQRHKFFN